MFSFDDSQLLVMAFILIMNNSFILLQVNCNNIKKFHPYELITFRKWIVIRKSCDASRNQAVHLSNRRRLKRMPLLKRQRSGWSWHARTQTWPEIEKQHSLQRLAATVTHFNCGAWQQRPAM